MVDEVIRKQRNAKKQAAWRKKQRAAMGDIAFRKHMREIKRRNTATWTPERREFEHRRTVLRRYGLTIADFDRMEREQDGLCAICLKPPTEPSSWGTRPRLVVDHNHKKGPKAVRSLLCVCCNLLVGYCGESIDTLQSTIEYLRRW